MRALLALAMIMFVFHAKADAMLPAVFPVVFGAEHAGLQGKAALPVGQKVFVQGRLLQVAWEQGGFVAFHEGTIFEVIPNSEGHPHIHLFSGSVNVMREGPVPISLSGPQGKLEVGQHSSINLQVQETHTAGRVMAGYLEASAGSSRRVFGPDEGFELSANGPRRTFTPPPAPSPSPATVEPAAGPERKENPKNKADNVAMGDLLAPALTAYQKVIRSLAPAPAPVVQPAGPVEVSLHPDIIVAQNEVEKAYNLPTQPEPQPAPQPEPEFITEQPSAVEEDPVRNDVYGAFAPLPPGISQPNNSSADAMGMVFSIGENGEQRLEGASAGKWVVKTFADKPAETVARQTIILRGTAEHADTYSNGQIAGLGRWVGGQLVAVADNEGSLNVMPMPSQADNMGGTSTHYMWGENATNAPTQGSINYTLQAATTPTYYGRNESIRVPDQPADARFEGAMRVDFASGNNGSIGRYHFSGNVTLTENGQDIGYGMATPGSGVILRNGQAFNEGSLRITQTKGPGLACAGGGACTGTVQVAPYGAGVENLGALYTIKGARSDVGLTGAALFGKE